MNLRSILQALAMSCLVAPIVAAAPVVRTAPLPVVCSAFPSVDHSDSDMLRRFFGIREVAYESLIIGEIPGKNAGNTLTIERTLGGHFDKKSLSLPKDQVPEGRAIYTVHRSFDRSRPFRASLESKHPHDAKHYQILREVLFDYRTLASEGVFVGRLRGLHATRPLGFVEVVRPVVGSAPEKGKRIPCVMSGLPSPDAIDLRLDDEPRLFFIHRHMPRFRDFPKAGKHAVTGPFFSIWFTQPLALEAKVKQAWNRRQDYPTSRSGIEVGFREVRHRQHALSRAVIYRGPVADVLDMLGSDDGVIRSLAFGTLFRRRVESERLLVRTLRHRLKVVGAAGGTNAYRLRYFVRMLGYFQREAGDYTTLRSLVDERIHFIERHPDQHIENEHWLGAHPLACLFRELPPEMAYRHYARKLRVLHGKTRGGWKSRVRYLIETLGVDEQAEVAEMLLRSKAKRLSSVASLWHHRPSGQGAFTPDGKHFSQVTEGGIVRIWRVADWSVVATHSVRANVNEQVFSPDGRWLYLACSHNSKRMFAVLGSQSLQRIDWKTGRVDRNYFVDAPVSSPIQLSADGKRLACIVTDPHDWLGLLTNWNNTILDPTWSPPSRNRLLVLDTDTGKLLSKFESPIREEASFQLHPSGTWLLRRTNERWRAEPIDAKPSASPSLDKAEQVHFDESGRYLLLIGASSSEKGRPLQLFDLEHKSTLVGERFMRGYVAHVATLPKQKVFSLARAWEVEPNHFTGDTGFGYGISILSLPSLESVVSPLPTWQLYGEDELRFGYPALTPDRRTVLMSAWPKWVPLAFDVRTRRHVGPKTHHRGEILGLHWLRNGQLLTYGSEGRLRWWGSATAKPTRSLELGSGGRILSIREPDGQVACWMEHRRNKTAKLRFVETRTGKSLGSVEMSCSWQKIEQVAWGEDKTVFVLSHENVFCLDYGQGQLRWQVPTRTLRFQTAIGVEKQGLRLAEAKEKSVFVEVFARRLLDSKTGKELSRANTERFDRGDSRVGLVPGTTWAWAGLTDLTLYHRTKLTSKPTRRFPTCEVRNIVFSPDGSRYALACRMPLYDDRVSSWMLPGEAEPIVRIHDTETGKLLDALRTSKEVELLRFDPSGKRLALVSKTDDIEVWQLSR